jgi:hypothetical protein
MVVGTGQHDVVGTILQSEVQAMATKHDDRQAALRMKHGLSICIASATHFGDYERIDIIDMSS